MSEKKTKNIRPAGAFPQNKEGWEAYKAQWEDEDDRADWEEWWLARQMENYKGKDPMDVFHAHTDLMDEEEYQDYMGRK